MNKINMVYDIAIHSDVVICSWTTEANAQIDAAFSKLANKCFVVVPAGNQGLNVDDFSPTRCRDVILVGALNKSGVPAQFNNFSKVTDMIWCQGTNYDLNGRQVSGTSVAAAICAANIHISLHSFNK